MGATREQTRKQLKKDGVQFILAQFVDMHGTAKVKMSPAEALDMLIDDGGGFAGGACWGMVRGTPSQYVMGRIDLDSYTPIPWQRHTARFACDLYVDNETHPF